MGNLIGATLRQARLKGEVNMLIGRHDSKIDEKGRISFPKKFRKELGNNLIITQGFEGSLIVIASGEWKVLTEGTEGSPITDKEARETETFLLGSAEEVSLDTKGRFVIPKHLIRFAGLSDEVSCLGLLRYVRIWDREKWEKQSKNLVNKIEEVAEKLSDKSSGRGK